MVDGVTHPRLGSQVNHDVEMIFREKRIDQRLVGDGALHEDMPDRSGLRRLFNLCETPLLEADFVIIIHVVQGHHGAGGHFLEKPGHEVGPDEARGARDQDGLVI